MAESFITLMADYCPEDQAKIKGWYDALQQAGFTGRQTPNLPFHISLASFPVEEEEAAIALTRRIAAQFAPLTADMRHVGILPGGTTLVAAPDLLPPLVKLQAACGQPIVHGYPWLPHTTLLIDEPETIGAAVPVLMKHFIPLRTKIDQLHLCAFWPAREILTIGLTGKE